MNGFFNMDNKFFTFMGRIVDVCLLTVLSLICCIPVITIGASLTALYYVCLKMVRNEESYIIRSFFKSFKQNFKQATVINLIMLAAAAVLYMDFNIAKNMAGALSTVMQIIFTMFGVIYAMILVYIYPVLAKFYNSTKNTFRNAFLMALRHLPYTVIMMLITLSPLLMFFIQSFQVQATVFLLTLFFGLGLIAYCNSWFLVRIFDNYIPAEDEEETGITDSTGAQP